IDFVKGGIDFLPVLIGVFAFAQIMGEIERSGGKAQLAGSLERGVRLTVSHAKVIWEILSWPFQLLWFAFVGVLIGVLPAIGASAASMMAYDQAKKISRHPEKFGSGIPEGIIASESSNNANVGGSLVTIMAFGIPGDSVTAVMLGALTIHGIQSGPLFISQNPQLAYGIFAAYLLAHPIMVLILALGARWMLRIVTLPKAALFPVVLVLCVIGAYALNNTMANVYVLLVFGVLGYLMVKFGFPLAPFILGVILGDQIEINLVVVAGSGLLDRRAFLRGGAALAAAMTGYTLARPAAAAPLADDPWSRAPGTNVPAYGVPSRFEKSVVRTLSNPNGEPRTQH